jgi:cullin 3
LFRHAYKLVLKKKGDELYDKVAQLEEGWLKNDVRTKVTSLVSPSINAGSMNSHDESSTERRVAGERFMKTLKDTYADHIMCVGMITDVLMYMVS